MALTRVEGPRAEALAAVARYFGVEIRDTIEACRTSAEEDLLFHLTHGGPGEDAEPIERWCAVTGTGEYCYLYPRYDERGAAERATVINAVDDIYSESPVAVVDLDEKLMYMVTHVVPVFAKRGVPVR